MTTEIKSNNGEDGRFYGDDTILQECCNNILRNIDRNLSRTNEDHDKVGKLLSMRWYVSNEINPKTN